MPEVFDPFSEQLHIEDGAWTAAYDGKDGQGHGLANGIYMLVISSDSAGSSHSSQIAFRVLGKPKPISSGFLAPNPVLGTQNQVWIHWQPSQPVEIRVYDAAGSLVKSFAPGLLPPLSWDLRVSSGLEASNGTYLVAIRVPGERHARVFKLALAR
jgi:hypothetical protein